ncbi:MAG: glycosyltransferase [Acidobacteriaceae bacterium]|nr:glycosyltransferase [Acidobacteriaceae bacterium]
MLHVFPSFAVGGAQARTAALMAAFGPEWSHTVVSLNGNVEALRLVPSGVDVQCAEVVSKRSQFASPFEMARLIRRLEPDLLLTYNWGAMDAVMGAQLARACPVIHIEDGFGPDEATRLAARRVITRRLLLNRIHLTIVPSRSLERIALEQYRLRQERLQLILNGIDTVRFSPGVHPALRRDLGIAQGQFVFGFVGQFRPEKNLPLLLRAFADLDHPGSVLLLVGGGPLRAELEGMARELCRPGSVIFTGPVAPTAPWYRALDCLMLTSSTEQMPIALLEGMASGLAAICTDVGDIRNMLSARAPEVVPAADHGALVRSMRLLLENTALRQQIAHKNRSRAVTLYSADRMIAEHRLHYQKAIEGWRYRRGPVKESYHASQMRSACHHSHHSGA